MSITSISRDTNNNVSLVRMISTDNLASISVTDYIFNEQDNINILNDGIWSWFMTDMIMCSASDGNAFFQFTDDTFRSLIIYGEQGSGTINPGLIGEVAYYPANGTNISGLTKVNNGVLVTDSSGIASISTLIPSATQLNITQLGTISSGIWNATPVTVSYGGTGDTSFTAYAVVCGGTTSTGSLQSVASVGSIGDILTSNGPGELPTFQTGIASGIIQTGNQNDLPYYSASPSGKTLSAISSAVNSILITSGMGVPSLSQTLPSAVQSNITTVGTIASGTWNGSVIGSTYGGTGLSNPTAHGVMIGEGSSAMTPIVLSSGQLLIGSTGIDPVAAAINSGTGILVANGAGSITVNLNTIADHTLLANISGGVLAPSSTTLTALIDNAIANTQGDILYRNATSWVALAPSTAGFVLSTGGAAANPSWASIPSLTGAALTKTDDTNVTLTLGGSPTTALLAATSLTLGWTGQLGLTRGGTAASLTASNGGIVYSTASALAILSGTATANQVLLSGSSAAPAWSTATYPPTTTINQLLYSSSANVIAGLATANSSVLVTSAGGVPSLSTTLPNINIGTPTAGVLTNCTGLLVAGGGTGAASFTAYAVICGGTTSTAALQSVASVGSSGQVLTSNGAAALPTFQNVSGTGTVNSGSQNQLAWYAANGTAVSGLSTANNGILVTSSGGVPSISGTLPFTLPTSTGGTGVTASDPVIQRVSTITGAVATGTTVVPNDDSIPQNNEGDQYMTLSITPKNSSNILVIDVFVAMLSNSAVSQQFTTALYQDSTANALAVASTFELTATAPQSMALRWIMSAGTTSSTTFNVRCGCSGAGTTTFNGAAGGRKYGGSLASSIMITEYAT